MTTHARSRLNGRNLIAQGEPLVWLTGGMFAIAICMIVGLVSLILYQGLATLWPRSYVAFRQEDGSIVSGEWIENKPYLVSKSNLGSMSEASQQKAKALLGDKESTQSTQLYLRTGNFDTTGKHFAYVPEVTLAEINPQKPADIWLVERLEWGILYGFPKSFHAVYSPSMDSAYEKDRLLLEHLSTYLAEETSESELQDEGSLSGETELAKEDLATFISRLQSYLDERAKTLEAHYRSPNSVDSDKKIAKNGAPEQGDTIPVSVIDRSAISEIAHQSYDRMRRNQKLLYRAQTDLGNIDRALSERLIQVRKAELREGTDLLSGMDEGLEIANSLGAVEQQWLEVDESWKRLSSDERLWRTAYTAPSTSVESEKSSTDESEKLQALRERMKQWLSIEMEQAIAPWKSKYEDWCSTFTRDLPVRSKESVLEALAFAVDAAKKQLVLNQEIARLDLIRHSESIEFYLPIAAEPVTDELNAFIEKDDQSKGTGFLSIPRDNGQVEVVWRPAADQRASQLKTTEVHVADMVRWFEPNRLSLLGKAQVYINRWIEFLFGEPREAGVEGGFFPAIWGTIVMTLLMSIAVMPFGVMAALYMREYAKNGWVLSLIRISINNLAGVPSIVYGVFGLAFFCYTVGGYIDGGPRKAGFEPWPPVTWFATCALTVVAGTAAFFFAFLGSGSPAHMSPLRKRVASFAALFWVLCLIGFVALIVKVPFFDGFYQATLPNPTFGKGCLLWASCTLALLTLPVVIVATEEALSAVPNSLREGSYGCGAGKWQTLQRIVLPYARPGIITGFILSMARGAGEVAPMMLVGAIPLATDLPLDLEFPFFHGSRSFMHLGFQIFSLGFQSQNSEAAKPMVFTATLLLLSIVTFLNVAAIWLRARLRKRFQSSQF